MFAQLLTVAALIAIFWIGCFVFYLYTSRQQESISREIENLKNQLDDKAGA